MPVVSVALLVVLLLWLQNWLYRRFWDSRLDLQVSFSAREAFEGDRLHLSEVLTNSKPLPLPWVVVKFQLSRNLLFLKETNYRISDDYYQNDMFSVNMYQRITRRLEFVCGRRGHYRIKSLDLASSNVFISSRLVKPVPCGAVLTVYPRLIPFGELEVVFRQVLGDIRVRRFTNPDPFAFQGIREYLPTDDFRSINFKATAKTGGLMVNVNSATASQELVILLNTEPYSAWPSGDVYEEGIRLAASAADYFLHQGLSVGLLSNGPDVVAGGTRRILPGSGEGHFRGILQRLARIDWEADAAPMRELLDGIGEDEPVYLLISSHDGDQVSGAFRRMRERGLTVHWILPALADTPMRVEEGDGITRWEVKPYDAPTYRYQEADH